MIGTSGGIRVQYRAEIGKDCQGLLRPKKTVRVRAAGLWSMFSFLCVCVLEE